ncbi:MAG: YfiR family protein [Desulfobacterales bacterium]|nr:YfiR family protein [Desulfobacterales bacterium]
MLPPGKFFALMILMHISLAPSNSWAQTGEYDVKAIVLWKIAQYIEWPGGTNAVDETSPFVIAVLGKNPFGASLENYYLTKKRKIKNRKVIIRYLSEMDRMDRFHVLFISKSEEKRIDDILSRVKGKSTLTVGDTKNFGKKGVHINFYVKKRKVQFEVNESAAAAEKFKVDYRLRTIAKIVGGKKGERR